MRTIQIDTISIGKDHPAFIIAEAGVNHNGDVGIAKQMITAAKRCGADAVKFQSFQAEKMCGLDLSETKDVEGITGGTKSSYEMYKALELSDDDHRILLDHARSEGILMLTSVFDEERIGFINDLGLPALKIASGDITYMSLIRKAAATGKPVLISTGMSTLDEVSTAVTWAREAGNQDIVLLHCTSMYPPPYDQVNLNAIITMRETFALPVGYSDHTPGIEVPIAAVAIGAKVIEKHFTLDRNMPGPDQKLSLDPAGFTSMIESIRNVEKAMGSHTKEPTSGEVSCLTDSRRSIVAARDIPAATVITRDMLNVLKPAKGLPPSYLNKVVGSRAAASIAKSEIITSDLIEGGEELCGKATFARR